MMETENHHLANSTLTIVSGKNHGVGGNEFLPNSGEKYDNRIHTQSQKFPHKILTNCKPQIKRYFTNNWPILFRKFKGMEDKH